MKKIELENIMVLHHDNDFCSVWEWIGEITLHTLKTKNHTGDEMLEDTKDIEKFILSLLPTAIEFALYRTSKYRNIEKDNLNTLVDYLKHVKFRYNFDRTTDGDYIFGGSETLIIDLKNNKSYIR